MHLIVTWSGKEMFDMYAICAISLDHRNKAPSHSKTRTPEYNRLTEARAPGSDFGFFQQGLLHGMAKAWRVCRQNVRSLARRGALVKQGRTDVYT